MVRVRSLSAISCRHVQRRPPPGAPVGAACDAQHRSARGGPFARQCVGIPAHPPPRFSSAKQSHNNADRAPRKPSTICIPCPRECGIFVRWSKGAMTGDRPDSIFIAVASKRSTTRKESYGYCQESCKKPAKKPAARSPQRRSPQRRSPPRRKHRQEGRAAKKAAKKSARKAQAQCGVHEGDDPVGSARRGRRQQCRCRAPKSPRRSGTTSRRTSCRTRSTGA